MLRTIRNIIKNRWLCIDPLAYEYKKLNKLLNCLPVSHMCQNLFGKSLVENLIRVIYTQN